MPWPLWDQRRGGFFCLLCCETCPLLVFLPWPGRPSLQSVEESLCHLDAAFFLGKVAFLATGGECLPCLLPWVGPWWTPCRGSLGDGEAVGFGI